MSRNPILTLQLTQVMRTEIALPLQHMLQVYTVGEMLARSGVRCNIVAPGSTDTAMQRALWTDDAAPQRVVDGDPATFRTGIPLGRIAAPRDIAEAVLFLASDRARHITMQELYVDGGATLR